MRQRAQASVTHAVGAVRSRAAILLVMLLAAATFVGMQRLMNTSFVIVEIETDDPTRLGIYWAGPGQSYAEPRSRHVRITPEKGSYTLLLPGAGDIERLRLDPATASTRLRLGEIALYRFGQDAVRIRRGSDFDRITALNQVGELRNHGRVLEFETTGGDPQLEVAASISGADAGIFSVAWRAAVATLVLTLLAGLLRRCGTRFDYVPYGMLAAFIVVYLMADVSRINAHPDEYVHLGAARYYIDHGSPPAACDPTTLDTYSPYGVSRLNNTEIAYFLNGRLASTLSFLPIADAYLARYFNVALFAILVLLTMLRPGFRVFCLPLLLSPQFWYMFSYINSEGFAIFAGVIAAWQVADPQSLLRRALDGSSSSIAGALVMVALFSGALLLVKKNFYVFVLYLGLWCATALLLPAGRHLIRAIPRFIPAVLAGLALYGAWIYQHHAANDFQRAERIAECREVMASSRFSESSPLGETLPNLFWRDKGRPFTDLFREQWGGKVFQSAFGDFGYLELHAGSAYYSAIAVLLVALVGFVGWSVNRRGDAVEKAAFWGAVATFAIILGATLWKAWTRDFQPQGRYFFPMIPIAALMLGTVYRRLNPTVLAVLVMALLLPGMWFFLEIGLAGIRRG